MRAPLVACCVILDHRASVVLRLALEFCQAVAPLVDPPDRHCLLVVDANVVLQPEDRVDQAGFPCGIVGGKAREFNRLIGSLTDINPVFSHVGDSGSWQ